jgi:galactose mutarotase-like enzyme
LSEQPFPWVSLGSSQLRAEIDPLGAQLSRLQDSSGRDLLWDGNPSVWNGRAPLLFPIVGSLNGGAYQIGGKRFQLPRHGLARTRRFEVVSASPTEATFRLSADDTTLAVYPFRFQLDIHFAVDGAALSVTARVRNAGDSDMPASFGFHPAFRWPLPFGQPRADHFIEFDTDEPDPVRRLNSSGLVTATLHPTPVSSRRLLLKDDLFTDDVIIFDAVHSRSVTYGAKTGPRIRVSYENAPYLGLWTKPGAGFICIEPWHGMSDPEGFSSNFSLKPGVFRVKPGEATQIRMTIELVNDGGAAQESPTGVR